LRLIDIYKKGIMLGLKNDFRLKESLTCTCLTNSIGYTEQFIYSDSAIIYGSNEKEIKNLFVCVDISISEILLAKELINNGVAIDGILSHHPTGIGAYKIPLVIDIQRDNWTRFGVEEEIANKLLQKLVWEENIEVRGNNTGEENAAKLLDIPLICLHTPIDNVVQTFFEQLFENKNGIFLDEALEIIKNIPECLLATKNGDDPFLINSSKEKEMLGNFMVDMTGGVDPPNEIFSYLKKAGLNTIIGMHYGLENIKHLMKSKLNAIICGHMACDSIGLNLFCDILEEEKVKIICGSGFYRYKRTKNQKQR